MEMTVSGGTVTEKGGILLGRHTVCDGYLPEKAFSIITHFAHSIEKRLDVRCVVMPR
jgi:hypothetical protein